MSQRRYEESSRSPAAQVTVGLRDGQETRDPAGAGLCSEATVAFEEQRGSARASAGTATSWQG